MSLIGYKTQFQEISGIKYAYHLIENTGPTILLLHGYPDTSYSFRHLVPVLVKHGYQIVTVDNAGFGLTVAPSEMHCFTLKTAADNAVLLLNSLRIRQFYVLGHDWGSKIAQNVLWRYPKQVLGCICVSVPFQSPMREQKTLEQVAKDVPSLGYQLFLASGIGSKDRTDASLDNYLKMVLTKGGSKKLFDLKTKPPPIDETLVSRQEFDICVKALEKTLDQTRFWYASHEHNCINDMEFLKQHPKLHIKHHCLFIGGSNDPALPPSMWQRQHRLFEEGKLQQVSLPAGHWILWEKPQECAQLILEYLSISNKAKL
ncbi:Alpha/Beta hydrolase protein [Gorgonomyces haynaldii]|nr:Alpha/Beta hydrolase protein [Gorgonomyces haynaldii]